METVFITQRHYHNGAASDQIRIFGSLESAQKYFEIELQQHDDVQRDDRKEAGLHHSRIHNLYSGLLGTIQEAIVQN